VEKAATQPFVMLQAWNVQWTRWVNASWMLKSADRESVCMSAVCYACKDVFFVLRLEPLSLLFILCVFVTVQWITVHFCHHV